MNDPVVTTTDPDPPESISGDFNGDNELTVADAVLFARFIGEDTTLTNEQIGNILNSEPDRDEDSLVTILDLTALLKELETE